MKSGDIKDAYNAVKATAELKEKLLLAEEEAAPGESEAFVETSLITVKKGGKLKKTVSALCVLAAAIAVVFALRIVGTEDIEYPAPPAESTTTATEPEPLPPDTAEVKVKVVDRNGVFVKNRRVDYIPIIPPAEAQGGDWAGFNIQLDEEHLDRIGNIPMTFEESTVVRLHYGTYYFLVSEGLANDTFGYETWEFNGKSGINMMLKGESDSGWAGMPVTVDENTTEVVFNVGSKGEPVRGAGEIIINDAEGNPIPDCTVILKPKSGEMAEGYTDTYGGYVLHRTDKNGSVIWKYPIEGEYTVIAYRERPHPISEPITDPVVIEGDDSYTYVDNTSVLRTYKIYTEAKEEN